MHNKVHVQPWFGLAVETPVYQPGSGIPPVQTQLLNTQALLNLTFVAEPKS